MRCTVDYPPIIYLNTFKKNALHRTRLPLQKTFQQQVTALVTIAGYLIQYNDLTNMFLFRCQQNAEIWLHNFFSLIKLQGIATARMTRSFMKSNKLMPSIRFLFQNFGICYFVGIFPPLAGIMNDLFECQQLCSNCHKFNGIPLVPFMFLLCTSGAS